MAFHLQIYGRTWSDRKAAYQYSLETPIKTDKEAQQAAGDFASVIDWRLVEETNAYEHISHGIARRIDTLKTLRGFRNGMNPQRFARLQYR